MKRSGLGLAAICALGLLLSGTPVQAETTQTFVVRVFSGEGDEQIAVSGFRVAENTFVTSRIAVQGATSVRVAPAGAAADAGMAAQVIATDRGAQLALIRITDRQHALSGPVPSLAATAFAANRQVIAMGANASGIVETRGETQTEELSGKRYRHSAALPGGSVGGVLVDTCGNVLGASSVGVSRNQLARGAGPRNPEAVSLAELTDFLSENGVTLPRAAAECGASAAQAPQTSGDQTNTAQAATARAEADAAAARVRELEAEARAARSRGEAARREAEEALAAARAEAEAKADDATRLEAEANEAKQQAANAGKDIDRLHLAIWIAAPILILALLLIGLAGWLATRKKAKAADAANAESAKLRRKIKEADNAPDWVLESDNRLIKLAGGLMVREDGLLIGRNPSQAGIVFEAEDVSRVHARFRLHGGTLTIEDMGSLNGTSVNGARLSPGDRIALEPGDNIALAAHRFNVRMS